MLREKNKEKISFLCGHENCGLKFRTEKTNDDASQ